jgi:hypothetical protein
MPIYKVDANIPHVELEYYLNRYPERELIRIIECSSIDGRDYVTLLWKEKEEIAPAKKEEERPFRLLEKQGRSGDNSTLPGSTLHSMWNYE